VKSAVAAKKSAQRCATRRQDACDPLPKNEIALLSPEDVSSAISMSYESPKRFVRWQPELVRPDCQFVFRQAIGGRRFPVSTRLASVNLASLAGHKICFHESHINYNRSHNQCGANRLFFGWLSSTAGYVPSNEAWISPSDMAHHQRVLSSGCYPFLSGRSENLSVFLRKPFGLN